MQRLQIIETCVRNAGLTYQSATNGLQALEKFKAERFDAVVMGMSLLTHLLRHESLTNARYFNASYGRPYGYKGNTPLREDGWLTTNCHHYPDCGIICRQATRGPSERG